MLRRWAALSLGMAFLLAGFVVATEATPAAADEVCEETIRGGQVIVVCRDVDVDGDQPVGGDDEGSKRDGNQICEWGGEEIPCTDEEGGIWDGQCYIHALDPQPDQDEPIWDGRTDGVIVGCSTPQAIPGIGFTTKWVPFIPGEDGPSAEELAQEAVAAMNLEPGQIGSAPHSDGMGLIGLPTWLWVANPAENTTGPITRSASDSGLTVTATATLDRIVYDMGDGQTVTCAEENAPGTEYDESHGDSPSPTCGHQYQQTSTSQPGQSYTVTADSYWTVEWSGGGESGTIPIDLSTSTELTIGESQAVVQ